jgi:hypothetical protein
MEKQLLSKVPAESSSLWFSFCFFKQKQVQKAELNAPTLKKFIYRLNKHPDSGTLSLMRSLRNLAFESASRPRVGFGALMTNN